jgi:hypothetical protein
MRGGWPLKRPGRVLAATGQLAYPCTEAPAVSATLKCNSPSESAAQHAYGTEFHRFIKLVTAARAGAFGLRACPNRPSAAI